MRPRAFLTLIAISSLALTAPGSAAEPRPSPTHLVAPYDWSGTQSHLECLAGTTCTPTATAEAATGRVTATMDMARLTNDEPKAEHGQGYGYQYLFLRAPRGASSVTATLTWTVKEASSRAEATHGRVTALSFVYATALCGGCTVTSSSQTIDASYTSAGLPDSGGVSDVVQVLTVTITDLPNNRYFRLYTSASAFARMSPAQACATDTCVDLTGVDAGHSGSAHAQITATLSAVDLTYT